MMSGSMLAPWASQVSPRENAKILGRGLNCPVEDSTSLLDCLEVIIQILKYLPMIYFKLIFQGKSMSDIITVVDEMIRFGNFSAIFSPVSDDTYLRPSGTNFLREQPIEALRRGNFKKVPILTGMMSEEGVLMGYFIKSQIDQLQTEDIK